MVCNQLASRSAYADAFVDKVQVFEDGRISVNLVYDDCLEELLQVKNKREGDLYE